MKRIISILFVAAIVMTCLFGCGKTSGKYKILDENFGDEEFGIGMRLGDNALTLAIQAALDELIADGTAGNISKEWFGEDKILRNKSFPRD